MPYFTDAPKCPKCSHAMEPLRKTCAIPAKYSGDPDAMTAISFEQAFPVEVHYCPHCRFVEMFAA